MTLDITVDLETCALCPTAAVLSLGAIAWNREGIQTPFYMIDRDEDLDEQHYVHVDLRSSFLDGFTFDATTSAWWSNQSADAKLSILENDDEDCACLPIVNVVRGFMEWVNERKTQHEADDVCLWSQGTDFDIAILRNICYKYGLEVPIKYTNFRDHRTFFMESARILCERNGVVFDPKTAYNLVEEYTPSSFTGDHLHNPIFDCKRSVYSTWQMMKQLRCVSLVES